MQTQDIKTVILHAYQLDKAGGLQAKESKTEQHVYKLSDVFHLPKEVGRQ